MVVLNGELTGIQIRGGTKTFGKADAQLPKPPKTSYIPGQLDYIKIREIRNDPTVKLVRMFIIAPAVAAGWGVEADKGVPQKIVKYIREHLIPLHDHVMLTGLLGLSDWGWQPFEKVFDVAKVGGAYRIVLKKLKPLLQDMTNILIDARTGAFAGLENGVVGTDKKTLEIEDCLVLNQNVEGTNWYGESDLIALYLLMEDYKRIKSAADKYDQKVAGAHWIVHYPVGTTPYGEEREEVDNFLIAKKLLQALEASGSVVIPSEISQWIGNLNNVDKKDQQWQIELISAEGSSSEQMLNRMKYLDILKARAYCVPERSILEGTYGTKAEAQEHGDFAVVNINLRRTGITTAINWHVVNPLILMNFGDKYVNKVRLIPNPINDETLVRNSQLFNKVLSDPTRGPEEMMKIDVDFIKDQLKIPSQTPDPEHVKKREDELNKTPV